MKIFFKFGLVLNNFWTEGPPAVIRVRNTVCDCVSIHSFPVFQNCVVTILYTINHFHIINHEVQTSYLVGFSHQVSLRNYLSKSID